MKKKHVILSVSYVAAIIVVLAGFIVKSENNGEMYREQLRYSYMRSLSDLCDSLSDINIELKKTAYVTTAPQLCGIAAEIYRDAATAQSALAQLPGGNTDLSQINKFVSQTGDYLMTVSKQAASGGSIDDSGRDSLLSLSKAAEALCAGVEEMRINYEDGKSMMLEISGVADEALMSTLADVQNGIEEYPSLIYDGPYSDHILTSESQMLSALPEVSADTAREQAAIIVGVDKSEVRYSGSDNGKLSAYMFDAGDTSISVSKRGGYVVYFRKYRRQGNQTFTYEQAVERAKSWLSEYIDEPFAESYYFTEEGVCTVNFAYVEGSTVCYTDLIKVGVSLDNGEIVLYQASGYLMNHKSRTVSTPRKTAEQAQQVVSKNLTVINVKRVLIPSAGNMEIPCYEFLCCDAEGSEVLVYVNSDTLMEEQVFLVLKTDGGTLTK